VQGEGALNQCVEKHVLSFHFLEKSLANFEGALTFSSRKTVP